MDDPGNWNMVYDDYDFEFKGWGRIYDETFLKYLDLLSRRSKKLQQLNHDTLDYSTYTDMCLVMLRAILIENPSLKNNYTVQNFLRRHDRDDLADRADNFINRRINKKYTLRAALKVTVDKFIAHYDTMTKIDPNCEEEWDVDSQFTRWLFLNDIKRPNSYPFAIPRIVAFIKSLVNQIDL